MLFVLGLWLVCGFFANLPAASSIQCYACGDYPGSTDPCEGSSAIQCESYFDSCSTTKTKVEVAGMDSNQTVKACAMAESPGCNQTYVCELVNKSVSAAGGKLLQCDVTCCQTDRCNGPDEERVEEVLKGFYAAIANEKEQKSNHAIDELKTNAAELMKKLDTKSGQSKKKRAAMTLRLKKREAKLSEVMESLARLAAQKR